MRATQHAHLRFHVQGTLRSHRHMGCEAQRHRELDRISGHRCRLRRPDELGQGDAHAQRYLRERRGRAMRFGDAGLQQYRRRGQRALRADLSQRHLRQRHACAFHVDRDLQWPDGGCHLLLERFGQPARLDVVECADERMAHEQHRATGRSRWRRQARDNVAREDRWQLSDDSRRGNFGHPCRCVPYGVPVRDGSERHARQLHAAQRRGQLDSARAIDRRLPAHHGRRLHDRAARLPRGQHLPLRHARRSQLQDGQAEQQRNVQRRAVRITVDRSG